MPKRELGGILGEEMDRRLGKRLLFKITMGVGIVATGKMEKVAVKGGSKITTTTMVHKRAAKHE